MSCMSHLEVYAVHSFDRQEVAMFPHKPAVPDEAVVNEVEIPAPFWAAVAGIGLAAACHFDLKSYKTSSARESLVGAAVKVPLLGRKDHGSACSFFEMRAFGFACRSQGSCSPTCCRLLGFEAGLLYNTLPCLQDRS